MFLVTCGCLYIKLNLRIINRCSVQNGSNECHVKKLCAFDLWLCVENACYSAVLTGRFLALRKVMEVVYVAGYTILRAVEPLRYPTIQHVSSGTGFHSTSMIGPAGVDSEGGEEECDLR
jgi:hypothetical protein